MATVKEIQLEKNVIVLRDMEKQLNIQIKELQNILQTSELQDKYKIEEQFELMLELKRSVLRTVYLMTEK